MRRFRSITERMASTQRTMTPGAGAGRTPIVAPQPRPLPKPETLTGADISNPLTLATGTGELVAEAVSNGASLQVSGASGAAPYAKLEASDDPLATLELVEGSGALTGYADSTMLQLLLTGLGHTAEVKTTSGEAYLKLNGGDAYFEASASDDPTYNGDGYAALQNNGAYIAMIVNGSSGGDQAFLDLQECTLEPSAPAANHVKLYAKDNGSGKTQLMARFATGASQQVSIQP